MPLLSAEGFHTRLGGHWAASASENIPRLFFQSGEETSENKAIYFWWLRKGLHFIHWTIFLLVNIFKQTELSLNVRGTGEESVYIWF